MIKKLLTDSFLYSLANLFTKGISFLLLPVLTANLSPKEFGVLDYTRVVGLLVLISMTLEIKQSIHRFIPEIKFSKEAKIYSSTSLWFTVFCYTLLCIFFLIFDKELSVLIYGSKEYSEILKVTAVLYFFNGIYYLLIGQLRCELKTKQVIFSSLAVAVTTSCFTAIALLWLDAGVVGVLTASTLSYLFGIIISWNFSYKSYELSFSRQHLLELLSFSVPLVPASLGVIASNYIDRVFIKEMLSFADLGVYGVASRISMVVSLLTVGFQQSLSPLIYSHYKDKGTRYEIAKIFWCFLFVATLLLSILYLSKDWLISYVATSDYAKASHIVMYMSISTLLSSMYLFFPGLSIAKKTKTISLISLTIAIVNSCLNFLCIPVFGLNGAVWSTLCSTLLGAFLYYIFAQKYYYIPLMKCLKR